MPLFLSFKKKKKWSSLNSVLDPLNLVWILWVPHATKKMTFPSPQIHSRLFGSCMNFKGTLHKKKMVWAPPINTQQALNPIIQLGRTRNKGSLQGKVN